MNFTFLYPNYLYLLIIIPFLILVHFLILRYTKGSALKFANFEAIARIKGIEFYSKNLTILFLTIAITFLLILSIAGLSVQTEMKSSSFSFVVAIDSSRSMEANDFNPTRMEAAKKTASDFIHSTPLGTNIGLISFSGNALIEQSMTDDKLLLDRALDKIQISGVGGTDLYEAIITSTNLLEGQDTKAVILLSDGQVNVGNLEDALDYANNHGVVIHTIAIGTPEGGETSYGLSVVDKDSLKSVSYMTKGTFFDVLTKEQLSQSFRDVLALKVGTVTIKMAPYLSIIVLMLFIIEYVLLSTRYKVLP